MTSPVDRLSAALADRYRIGRELGQGGMATVYLAEDLKHHRQVAIKVLLPELAAVLGAERFVQEITTTAQLQHPNILPLFDSGTAGQRDGGTAYLYYVMPYIEGETLRTKLDREKQLGVDEALKISTEVADALDYAHRHGVIHRDIKPENILLHDGRPMVADFGIALAVSAAAGNRRTETGLSLGTPHYMSPEQATAEKDITARSDIYSLASVLYEMLTGNPPHTGASAQQIIMKIIAEPVPEVTTLRKAVPANVAAALTKALEKLPADRFESAKTFAEALANPTFTVTTAATRAIRVPAVNPWRRWLRDPRTWGALLALGAAVALALLRTVPSGGPAETGVLRFTIRTPADSTILAIENSLATPFRAPVVSPDGRTVAFEARTSAGPVIYLRRLDTFDLFKVPGEGRWPVFSPDNASLAYFRGVEAWTLDLAQPVPTRVGALPEAPWDIYTAAWHPDGRILVAAARGLWAFPRGGGDPVLLVAADSAARETIDDVSVLPDGRILLDVSSAGESHVEVTSADGTGRTRVLPGYERAAIVDDIVLFVQGRQNRASRIDSRRLEPVGRAIALPDEPPHRPGRSVAWVVGTGERALEPVWVSRAGSVSPIGIAPASYRWPRVSPDGRRLALGLDRLTSASGGLRVVTLGTRAVAQLAGGTEPVWSADGRTVFASRNNRPLGGLVSQVADGSRAPDTLLALEAGDAWPTGVSPDGRWLAYYGATLGVGDSGDATDPNDLMFIDLRTRESRRIRIPGAQRGARFSPDGRWVAFQSTESGAEETYVRPWPAMDARFQISSGGGTEPLWSRDGRAIYFRQRDAVVEVPITAREGTIERAPPRTLFTGIFHVDRSGDQSWDLAPDGRFLMLRPVGGGRMELDVTLNWLADVRERLARAQ